MFLANISIMFFKFKRNKISNKVRKYQMTLL